MTTELGRQWGERIKSLRIGSGTPSHPNMTQQQLADAVGVTNVTVSRWETGQTLPRPRHQIAVGRALGVPPSSIFVLPNGTVP